VDKALAVDPRYRFQTAGEMQAAIAALLPQGTTLDPSMIPGPLAGGARSDPYSVFVQHTAPLLSPLPPPPPSRRDVAVPPPVAATATAFSEPVPPAQRTRPRWLFALSSAPLVMLLGIGIRELRRPPVPSNASGAPAAQVEASIATQTRPESGAEVTVAPPPSALDASVTAAAPAPSSAPPAARARPVALSRPAAALPAAPATVPVAPVSRSQCEPPYTFNADGKKIWKRDCL
jgi:hypothetical protein